nr:MAG TPA: hypothetical protein [Caudoviricetes sp.]
MVSVQVTFAIPFELLIRVYRLCHIPPPQKKGNKEV